MLSESEEFARRFYYRGYRKVVIDKIPGHFIQCPRCSSLLPDNESDKRTHDDFHKLIDQTRKRNA